MKLINYIRTLVVILAITFKCLPAHAGWAWPWQAGELAKQAEIARQQRVVSERRAKIFKWLFALSALGAAGYITYLRKNRTVVQKVVKQEVVNKVVQEVRVVRTPAHELVTDKVIVDGLNVIFGYGTNQKPNLLNLLALLIELKKGGYSFKCYFDPGTYYCLNRANKNHASAYRRLVCDYPQLFVEVPVHNKADGYILDYAHSHGTPIISNDRFRDYEDKYSWIASDAKRRVAFINDTTVIQALPLGIQAAIPNDLEAAEKSLRMALGEKFSASTKSAQAERGNMTGQPIWAQA